MKNQEVWKDVKNYEGLYQVSSLSRIKSLSRTTKGRWGDTNFKERLLKQYSRDGYLAVKLCFNNVQTNMASHRIIAMTFIPNPENKLEVNHKDGNKLNNSIDNLEWCTHQENIQHSYDTKLNVPKTGEKHHRSKLKNKEVLQIRKELRVVGCNQTALAKKYKVSNTLITYIKNNKLWKTIK